MRTEAEIRARIAYLEGARSYGGRLLAQIASESVGIANKELLWVLGEWEFKQNPKIRPIMYDKLSEYKKRLPE